MDDHDKWCSKEGMRFCQPSDYIDCEYCKRSFNAGLSTGTKITERMEEILLELGEYKHDLECDLYLNGMLPEYEDVVMDDVDRAIGLWHEYYSLRGK